MLAICGWPDACATRRSDSGELSRVMHARRRAPLEVAAAVSETFTAPVGLMPSPREAAAEDVDIDVDVDASRQYIAESCSCSSVPMDETSSIDSNESAGVAPGVGIVVVGGTEGSEPNRRNGLRRFVCEVKSCNSSK